MKRKLLSIKLPVLGGIIVLLLFLFPASLSAQQKFALVIGNSNYTGISRLNNPVNDANDMEVALKELGFTVEKVLNGNLEQMETAVMRLKNRLSVSGDAYGFFFYAGHGVQSNGENYLIPVDANIPGENFLRSRTVSVQTVLDELNDARNKLNVVVLDACRDNPFGWARSGNRGLMLVSRQPADSIIVYATSAGQTASDGTGRNGLFTGQLLNNLRTPGLEVAEVFKRTGANVAEASGRRQIPAVYNQFFGTAYLGEQPIASPPTGIEVPATTIATGTLEIRTVTAGTVVLEGEGINRTIKLPAQSSHSIDRLNAGKYRVLIRYENQNTEVYMVNVMPFQKVTLQFTYR